MEYVIDDIIVAKIDLLGLVPLVNLDPDIREAMQCELRRRIHEWEFGDNVNGRCESEYHLISAVIKGNLRRARISLDNGADVSLTSTLGMTALHHASYLRDNSEKVLMIHKLLLEKGASCNAQDPLGTTPFHVALMSQPLIIAKLLIQYGADVTAVNINGGTALHYAARNVLNTDNLRFIVDQGLDIECSDKNNLVALHHAASTLNYAGCELLLKRGAIITKMNSLMETPLTMAILSQVPGKRKLRTVQVLLAYGADMADSTLKMAIETRCSASVKKLLIQYMAKLQYLNMGIHEDDLRIIESEDNLKNYYETCLQELESMNAAKFYGDVSVLSILIESEKTISRYARNDELVNALVDMLQEKGNDWIRIYFGFLKNRFYAKVMNHKIRSKAAEVLSNLLKLNGPFHLVIQKILRYLPTEDLVILTM